MCVCVCRAPAQKHARGPNYPRESWRLSPQKPELLMWSHVEFFFFLDKEKEAITCDQLANQSQASMNGLRKAARPPCSILLRSRHFYRNHGGRGLARMVWGAL